MGDAESHITDMLQIQYTQVTILQRTGERTLPPQELTILTPKHGAAFGVKTHNTANQIEIKLAIELPFKGTKNPNNVALLFKRFIIVLMAANREIRLLKWESSAENPIAKAINIAYDEDTINEYFSGMKMKSDRRRIVGFTQISSPVNFTQIKKHSQFLHWLQNNKV